MPELKHTFQGGKMEKDIDERIVPRGQYREALNISVSTSEGSDVGAAQNILGNIVVTQATKGRIQLNAAGIPDPTTTGLVQDEYDGDNYHIAQIIDPQSDMLYRFVHTTSGTEGIWMDRIIEYNTTKPLDASWQDKENAVMVDIYKVESMIETCGSYNCTDNDKTAITLTNNQNLNQLRWGMRVDHDDFPFDTTIEEIDYVGKKIILNKAFTGTPNGNIIFHGDRNLNFSPERNITGINIIDGMLFWTDNYSEPKKIDIERCKMGSKTSLWSTTPGLIGRYTSSPIPKIDDFNQHTVLVVADNVKYDCIKDDCNYQQTTEIND